MNCTLSSLASSPWLSCVIFLLLCICFKDCKQLQLIKVQTHFSSQLHLLHILSRKTYVKKIKYMYPFCRKQIDVTGYTHVSQLKLSFTTEALYKRMEDEKIESCWISNSSFLGDHILCAWLFFYGYQHCTHGSQTMF